MPIQSITYYDSPRFRKSSFFLPRKHLETLRKAWQERRLVLLLGAGLSQPFGLRSWDALVLEMLLSSGRQIVIDKYDPRDLALWIMKRLELSPTILARVARVNLNNQLREERRPASAKAFATHLRDVLYGTYRLPTEANQTSMATVIDLLKASEGAGRHIPFVITYNFDDILETQLKASGISSVPIFSEKSGRPSPDGPLPVYHPHGFLPHHGPLPNTELVFTEDQYHRRALSGLHWATVKVTHTLSEYTCLMIGLSLTDPAIRQLIDAIPRKSGTRQHFLVRRLPSIGVGEVREVLAHLKKRRKKSRMTSGGQSNSRLLVSSKRPEYFAEILGQLMRYEGIALSDLGIAPLWIKEFGKLAGLLGPITSDG